MSLLDNIKKLANSRNLTIAELERKAGLANGTISKWDKSSPSIAKVQAIADYFCVSVDYLLGEEKSPSPEGNELDAQILRLFNSLPEAEQLRLLGYAQGLADSQK